MERQLLFLLLSFSLTLLLPPCPYFDSAGEHHFVPSGSSKTIHIHQPFWETAGPMNWDQAQAFCNSTYNNATYSGGRLWEPASLSEYDAVRTEMVTVFPDTGPACTWWVGVHAPGTTAPRDAFLYTSGDLVSWHTVDYVGGPYVDGSYSGPCVTIDDDFDEWRAHDCYVPNQARQWICESFTIKPEPTCITKDPCKNAFPDSGLEGFCSDVSWKGGDCTVYNSKGVPLCPFYENGFPVSIPGKVCTCCKECLDNSCASKGPLWSCVNYAASLQYHQGSCVYDDSCTKPESQDSVKEQCACCKAITDSTTTTTSTKTTSTMTASTMTSSPPEVSCQDNGCSQSLEGQGICVSLNNADWAQMDNFYNLSVSTPPSLCSDVVSGSSDCCKCVMKKSCRDLGCKDHWQGQGICITTASEDLAKHAALIDFSVGGQDDLCSGDSGCCTCFKKKTGKEKQPSCCPMKTVGGLEYELVDYDLGMVQSLGCSVGCIYKDQQGNKVCFKPGKEEATCNML